MAEVELIQRQRELLRAFRQSSERRSKGDEEAALNRKATVSTIELALSQVRDSAARHLEQAEEAKVQSEGALGRVKLEYLLSQTSRSEHPSSAITNPDEKLVASTLLATDSNAAIESGVSSLLAWREKRSTRRAILITAFAILLLVCVIVSFFGFQTWQRGVQIEQLYQEAMTNVEAGNLDQAAKTILALQKLEPNYKNLDNFVSSRPDLQKVVRRQFLVDKRTLYLDLGIDTEYGKTHHLEGFYQVGLNSMDFYDQGTVRLNLQLWSSGSHTIEKPNRVNLKILGESIPVSGLYGIFQSTDGYIQVQDNDGHSPPGTNTGTLIFENVLDKIASTDCFELEYGTTFRFDRICLFAKPESK